MKKTTRLVLVCLLCLVPALTCGAAESVYRAVLAGGNELPKVKTPATGRFKLLLAEDGLSFELEVDGITSPAAANIHQGKRGENGPPVAGLFGGPTRMGRFKGILAEGVITDKNLLGELQGKTLADLVRLIKSGNAYVNVLTETYPAGEIRGQIFK